MDTTVLASSGALRHILAHLVSSALALTASLNSEWQTESNHIARLRAEALDAPLPRALPLQRLAALEFLLALPSTFVRGSHVALLFANQSPCVLRLGIGSINENVIPSRAAAVTLAGSKSGGATAYLLLDSGEVKMSWLRTSQNYVPGPWQTMFLPPVLQISCGQNHTLAVLSNGVVLSWGNTVMGALGHADRVKRDCPTEVEALRNIEIIRVSAGLSHSLFISSSGGSFSCGHGATGELGHGITGEVLAPQKIVALRQVSIVQCAAGSNTSFFLSRSGKAWSCGYGQFGKLGHGHKGNMLSPVCIQSLLGAVMKCAVAPLHTLFLEALPSHAGSMSHRCRVLGFGSNIDGQLGFTESEVFAPREMQLPLGAPPIGIAASEVCSLVLLQGGGIVLFADALGGCQQHIMQSELMKHLSLQDNKNSLDS